MWKIRFLGTFLYPCHRLQATSLLHGPTAFLTLSCRISPIYCPCSSAGGFQCHPQKTWMYGQGEKVKMNILPQCFSPHWQLVSDKGKNYIFQILSTDAFCTQSWAQIFSWRAYEPELIDWGDRWFEVVTEGGQGVPCGEWRQDMSCIRGDIVVMGRRQGD